MTHKSFLTLGYVLFYPLLIFLHFICTFSFCVMCMCTQYWCWSYVFSAFAFFSYCLPGLFGSSSSQSVCYFLSLLRVYICVSVITSHQKFVVSMRHELSFCWIILIRNVLFFQLNVNCAHLFMGLCVFPLVVLSPWWFWDLFPILWHFKSFLVELWHGCLQASVENIMKEKMPKKGGRWWFSWRSRNSDIKSVGWLTFRLFF